MSEILTDNRFELIEKYKQELINATNIEDDKKEMAAIDNILFRFWQMGWLDKLEESDAGMTVAEYRARMIEAFHNADCDSLISVVVLPIEKEFQVLEWLLKNEYIPFLEKANKALKAPQWIPCSERLPIDDDYRESMECLDGCVWYFTNKGSMGLGYYYYSTKEWSTVRDLKPDGKVIAWMPLPEPYEVEK